MRVIALLIGSFLVSGLFVGLNSCKKETACIASIKCIDSVGNGVSNAYVMLYALVKSADGKRVDTADVRANGTSDADGMLKITFKLPATYDIYATKQLGAKKLTGLSVIKLEDGQTIEKTVTLHY